MRNCPNTARKRRKKFLKLAKSYFGSKHRLFKSAKEQVMNSLSYAYRDRKKKKTQFRQIWITRISASLKDSDLNYANYINALKKANINLNRKMLSEIAINNPELHTSLVNVAKEQLKINANK
ncbi:50S ribosomal protein L20 [symbiont of Argiope bruennichi]|uniref:50S ribosomal protein L20 n=1 Tax=symbiont of Argiope bruennichi TaxID=2810479 RepID=UPI003DA5F9F5